MNSLLFREISTGSPCWRKELVFCFSQGQHIDVARILRRKKEYRVIGVKELFVGRSILAPHVV